MAVDGFIYGPDSTERTTEDRRSDESESLAGVLARAWRSPWRTA